MKKIEDILIGNKIKKIRISLGMNQKEFAKIIGSNVSALSNWENGRNKPNMKKLSNIAKIGKTTVEALLYNDYYRYYFDIYWEKCINKQRTQLYNFFRSNDRFKDLEEEHFEYLEKEKIFEFFYDLTFDLNFDENNPFNGMGEDLFIIAVQMFLDTNTFSDTVIIENLILHIKEKQEKIKKNFFKIVDGEKQFIDNSSKLAYEKFTLSTKVYLLVLEETLKEITKNHEED